MPVSILNQKFENLFAKLFFPGMFSFLKSREPTHRVPGSSTEASRNFVISSGKCCPSESIVIAYLYPKLNAFKKPLFRAAPFPLFLSCVIISTPAKPAINSDVLSLEPSSTIIILPHILPAPSTISFRVEPLL